MGEDAAPGTLAPPNGRPVLQPDAVRAVMHQRPQQGSPPIAPSTASIATTSSAPLTTPASSTTGAAQAHAIPRSFTLPLPGPDRTLVDPRPGMALANQRSGSSTGGASGQGGGIGGVSGRPQVDASLGDDLPRLWAKLLETAQDNRRMRVVLADLTPVSLHELVLTLRPAPSAMLAAKSQQGDIEVLILNLVGKRIAIDLIEPAQQEVAATNTPTLETISAHPLIARAVELLGGKVIGVQPRKKP